MNECISTNSPRHFAAAANHTPRSSNPIKVNNLIPRRVHITSPETTTIPYYDVSIIWPGDLHVFHTICEFNDTARVEASMHTYKAENDLVHLKAVISQVLVIITQHIKRIHKWYAGWITSMRRVRKRWMHSESPAALLCSIPIMHQDHKRTIICMHPVILLPSALHSLSRAYIHNQLRAEMQPPLHFYQRALISCQFSI